MVQYQNPKEDNREEEDNLKSESTEQEIRYFEGRQDTTANQLINRRNQQLITSITTRLNATRTRKPAFVWKQFLSRCWFKLLGMEPGIRLLITSCSG